jgi:hypothetical protein
MTMMVTMGHDVRGELGGTDGREWRKGSGE